MNFKRIDELKKEGFSGFLSIKNLWETKCEAIPEEPGVYIVCRKAKRPPKFRRKSKAGLYKGEDLTVPISKLRENWVPGTQVIYIGKAGSSTTKQGLKKRLRKLVYTGFVPKAQRKGGRLIWQLADAEDLILCWKVDLGEEPADYERRLITAFEKNFGKKPFANLI